MYSRSSVGLILLLVAFATISCGSKTPATLPRAEQGSATEQRPLEQTPLAEERPAYLNAIFDQTDRMSAPNTKMFNSDPLITQVEQTLRADPENAGAQILLAQLYISAMDYRRGMTWTEKLVKTHPRLSDGHYMLGDLYYELGLGDMALRGLFKIDSRGLMLFQPDATTKSLFSRAIAEFTTASHLTETLTHRTPEGSIIQYSDPEKSEQRRGQAAIYISGAPEEAVFTEDQAHVDIWLMHANNGNDKRAQDIVRKQLQFYLAEGKTNGTGLMPNAVPSGSARQYGPEILGRLGEMNKDSMDLIRNAGVEDSAVLAAAAELGTSLPAWIICGQLGNSNPDLAPKAALVVRSSGDAILHDGSVLQIKFSSKALSQLRAGETSGRLMPDEVDAFMRLRPEADRVRRVFLITSRETFLLLTLSMLPVEQWNQMLPVLPQWKEFANFADMASDPRASLESLRSIISALTDAATRGDFAGIDSGTDSLRHWCADILLSVIRSNS